MEPPPEPPTWLRDFFRWLDEILEPIGRFFSWLNGLLPNAPYARILLWTVLAVLAASLLWLIYQRLRYGTWQWRRQPAAAVGPGAELEWAPDHVPARRWLEEADALAADGRYAEAIHHLLVRSVEDIARKRSKLVKPAVTSRELAATQALPTAARTLFSSIAGRVERSLFGGRPVGAEDWAEARRDYADFALPGAWEA